MADDLARDGPGGAAGDSHGHDAGIGRAIGETMAVMMVTGNARACR